MNYFDILNVTTEAEPEIIKASYRALAKKYHPDSYNGDKEEAERKMTEINEAYNVLSDVRLREEYKKRMKSGRDLSNSSMGEQREKPSGPEYPKKDVSIPTPSYEKNDNDEDLEIDKYSAIVLIIIIFIIIVSIICCIVHFGPGILKVFLENVTEQLEKLKYNFS